MAFGVTSNYAGKAAGFYINAALNEARSLDFLTTIENIKYKSNIQKYSNSGLITNAGCDFSSAGNLTGTEAVLEPKNLMINLDLCKQELLDSWEALQMRAGAGAPPPASFDDYVLSYMGEIIADGIEGQIWNGSNGAGQFLGFAYPTAAAGILFANMNEDWRKTFNGIKIALCPGMNDDQLVAAQKSNMFFGTDLVSDMTRIQLMDMAKLDGSDNMRLVARFSGGVQTAIGGDVVLTA
jgi:hypothetical protein